MSAMSVIHTGDLEVDVKEEGKRAVIAGKTSISFEAFVALILQRKVLTLFKRWGKDSVIVNSELLTTLASAPQDNNENRTHLIIVTLGVGVLTGVFGFALLQILLLAIGITVDMKDLFVVAGGLVGLTILVVILSKLQRARKALKITEKMETVAGLLKK